MFQTAGARRSAAVIGSSAPVAGSRRVKSRMRCASGPTPVVIVVQRSGESGGCCVRSTPERPSRTSAARFGMSPRAA